MKTLLLSLCLALVAAPAPAGYTPAPAPAPPTWPESEVDDPPEPGPYEDAWVVFTHQWYGGQWWTHMWLVDYPNLWTHLATIPGWW